MYDILTLLLIVDVSGAQSALLDYPKSLTEVIVTTLDVSDLSVVRTPGKYDLDGVMMTHYSMN